LRILGLVASPRKLGNSEILVKEMLASLPAEFDKEMIHLPSLHIEACKACYACLPEDKNCIINDHLAFLLERIKAADAVIIASACYFLGSQTSIKTISDRLIAILANSHEFIGKKCVTATVYGIPGWEGYAREAVNNFARFLHLDVVGDMLVQAASPGEVVEPDTLGAARQLAAKLLDSSATPISAASGVLACQSCGSSMLQLSPSGQVRCSMCNATGEIKNTGEGYAIVFTEAKHQRFSPAGMAEHSDRLGEVKNSYIANRQELFRRRKPYEAYNWWIVPEEK
jgi:LSD1 subclass zinc finger protein